MSQSLRKRKKFKESIHNLTKEKQFNNRYRLGEKVRPYQSLIDEHSAFYFCSRPAKKQLRSFRRNVLEEEPNSSKKFQLSQMINFRIRKNKQCSKKVLKDSSLLQTTLFDFDKMASSSIISLQTLYHRLNQKEQLTNLPNNKQNSLFFSGGQQSSINKQVIQTEDLKQLPCQSKLFSPVNPQELLKEKKKKSTLSEFSDKGQQLRSLLHRTKHTKWMSFLQEKKEQYLGRVKTDYQ